MKRLKCLLYGHNWIAAQCHWWDWGGSHLWTPTPSHDGRWNGVGCRRCGRFDYVQQAAPRPEEGRDEQ